MGAHSRLRDLAAVFPWARATSDVCDGQCFIISLYPSSTLSLRCCRTAMHQLPLVRLVYFFAYAAMSQTFTVTVRVPVGTCGANNRSLPAISSTATNVIGSSNSPFCPYQASSPQLTSWLIVSSAVPQVCLDCSPLSSSTGPLGTLQSGTMLGSIAIPSVQTQVTGLASLPAISSL